MFEAEDGENFEKLTRRFLQQLSQVSHMNMDLAVCVVYSFPHSVDVPTLALLSNHHGRDAVV